MKQVKVLSDFAMKYATKENLEKLEGFLKQADEAIDEYGDKAVEVINSTSETIKSNIEPLCEIIEKEELSVKLIKDIIKNNINEPFASLALLKGGYNSDNEKHIFYLQPLNKMNKPTNKDLVYCIIVDNVDVSLKNNFSDKDLLIIK